MTTYLASWEACRYLLAALWHPDVIGKTTGVWRHVAHSRVIVLCASEGEWCTQRIRLSQRYRRYRSIWLRTDLFGTGVIPQSLQLQALVISASLCWHHKSGQCAKSCARRPVCLGQYCSASMPDAVMFPRYEGCRSERLAPKVVVQNAGGLCGINPAIHSSHQFHQTCGNRNLSINGFRRWRPSTTQ